MTPKEWAFIFELLEETAKEFYEAGKENDSRSQIRLTRADKLMLKTQLEKYVRNSRNTG